MIREVSYDTLTVGFADLVSEKKTECHMWELECKFVEAKR